jgi:hypothetical protein
MAYKLPTFNLHGLAWRNGNATTNPADVAFHCNLRACTRPNLTFDPFTGGAVPMEILTPALTDLRDSFCPAGLDTVEIVVGSGRFYFVYYVDDVAKGFPNEYRVAVLFKKGPWPQPIP